ncbi:MAG TPA: hypothetical protein VFS88_01680 [Micavibrio sp.]|nr:hypothetical protein [Micavibrio sp.]
MKPISAPPRADDAPPLPGTTGAPKSADGLPILQAKGNNTQLFSQKLSSEVSRLDRLENAVQELRNDFDAMAPAIVRLVSIEKDIQNLISQLEVLTGDSPAAPVDPIDSAMLDDERSITPLEAPVPLPPDPKDVVVEPFPVPAHPQQAPSAQEPAAASSPPAVPAAEESTAPPPAAAKEPVAPQPVAAGGDGPAVTAMRIGEHPGKIRIVLDMRGKTAFTADLDNKEKILVVELPKAAWNAESQKSFSENPLLSSYRTEAAPDGGTMLILQLKSASSIGYKASIDNPGGGSRIVIDLTR